MLSSAGGLFSFPLSMYVEGSETLCRENLEEQCPVSSTIKAAVLLTGSSHLEVFIDKLNLFH